VPPHAKEAGDEKAADRPHGPAIGKQRAQLKAPNAGPRGERPLPGSVLGRQSVGDSEKRWLPVLGRGK